MQQSYNHPCMTYLIGDDRDKGRKIEVIRGVDYSTHAAALIWKGLHCRPLEPRRFETSNNASFHAFSVNTVRTV